MLPNSENAGSSTTPEPSPGAAPARERRPERPHMGSVSLSDEVNAEIDAAMSAAMESAPPPPPPKKAEAPAKPAAIRGPRVIQAGREQRPGKVVSVGPTDVFVEFGPKELGVVPRLQWPEESELPKVGDTIEVVVNQRDADGLLVCSRPGQVQKAEWEL